MKKLCLFACCLVALAGCNKPDPADSEDYIVADSGRTVGQLLRQLREDEDPNSWDEAREALLKLGPEDMEAVPALLAALKDENWVVRYSAVQALGQIEPTTKQAEYAVAKVMEDKNREVSRAAI